MQNSLRTLLLRAIVLPAMVALMLLGCGERVEREAAISGSAGDRSPGGSSASDPIPGENGAGSGTADNTAAGGAVPSGGNTGSASGGTGTSGSGTNTGGGAVPRSISVGLAWDAPFTYMDGTSLTVAGYKIYYGNLSGKYAWHMDVGKITSYRIDNLSPGTYYFAATAYDANGIESVYSNEASTVVY